MTTARQLGLATSGTSIVCLHLPRGPSDIARLIAAVIVDTVKSVALRTAANVFEKSTWIVQPWLVHLYSSPTIVSVGPICRIRAASLSCVISAKFGRNAATASQPVCGGVLNRRDGPHASAARGVTRLQVACSDQAGATAVALANPFPLAATRSGYTSDSQEFAEAVPRQVNGLHDKYLKAVAGKRKSVEAIGIGGVMTGLIGILGTFKPRTTTPDEPQDVNVVNKTKNPVPTVEGKK